MRVHWLQHVPFEGLGSIEPWMHAQGHTLTGTRVHTGELPPPVTAYDWLIVMGGPMNIYQQHEHPWLAAEKIAIHEAIDTGRRVLGICLGAQLIADALGARITRNAFKEIGWFPVQLSVEAGQRPLLADFPQRFDAYHWHGDSFSLPPGTLRMAWSEGCAQQAFIARERVVGLQFHLEITPAGAADLIDNARHDIEDAPYVQQAEAMLADPVRFTRSNALMDSLLHQLAAIPDEPRQRA